MDTRRVFLKKAALLAGATIAGLPAPAFADAEPSPRRVELLDSGWRFRRVDAVLSGTRLTDWLWTPAPSPLAGRVGEGSSFSPLAGRAGEGWTPGDIPPLSASWKKTNPGDDTLAPSSDGWYRTVLPDLKGPGRTVHFECVDDIGTVFLNGKKLLYHEGWSDPFDVNMDSAWHAGGPNVLVVLVQNLGGPGGIRGPVTANGLQAAPVMAGALYDDSDWRIVHLPHDYVVEGDFDPHGDVGHGALPLTPAWYRRQFHLPQSDQGKSVQLYFEGVFRNATVYVNGKAVHFQDDGYDPFHIDISNVAQFGADNVLAVHVDPRSAEGWWYEGGGSIGTSG